MIGLIIKKESDWRVYTPMNNSTEYFENTACIAYPCHPVCGEGKMNCLFCYCPFYWDEKCLGTHTYLDNRVKDCSACVWVHDINNYEAIIKLLRKKLKKHVEVQTPLIVRIRKDRVDE